MVQQDEMRLQEDTARTNTSEKSHSRSDKASKRDWFQIESQMIMARYLCDAVMIFTSAK
jgi:hypothetical protein